jgi:uncharacterized protein (TIGR00106 family)
MKAIADICVVPVGVGVSVSEYVVVCEKIFREAGLNPGLHAYGTNVEGEWDEVMAALRRCHERIHEMGAPRISTSIRIGTRTDREQTMQDKIESVTSKLDDC